AAALFVLSLLQVRVSHADGRFELSFALPGARPAPLESARGLTADEARAIAVQEVSNLEGRLDQVRDDLTRGCELAIQQERGRLAQAVDYTLARNQEVLDTSLDGLVRAARQADLETQRAVTNLASYVARPNH